MDPRKQKLAEPGKEHSPTTTSSSEHQVFTSAGAIPQVVTSSDDKRGPSASDRAYGSRNLDFAGTKQMTYEEAVAKRDQLKTQIDNLQNMADTDTLQLQQMMEQKNHLEEMIANMLKKAAAEQQSLSDNLK